MGNCWTNKHDALARCRKRSLCSSNHTIRMNHDDYRICHQLNKDCSGKLYMVQRKSNDKYYAMKVISKSDIKLKNKIKQIQSEREALEKLRHPFLLKFYHAFQTKRKLHLILELATGGSLLSQINKSKFNESQARFYAAEIILVLSYLHDNSFIFGGLKPEDVLIDKNGHIKGQIFGSIKLGEDGAACDTALSTASFCGSSLYMAPEVIKDEPHTKAVDWWSLGVLIYEMLSGEPPFWDIDSKKLMKSILESKVHFSDKISENAKDLISKLLNPDPNERLGTGPKGVSDIMEHPFFEGFNWKA